MKGAPNFVRITLTAIATEKAGIQTQRISLFITAQPHLLKKALMPIGETAMGVHGEKYLVLLKGERKAIPRPPLVKASRIPWLADTRKKRMQ